MQRMAMGHPFFIPQANQVGECPSYNLSLYSILCFHIVLRAYLAI